MTRDGRSSVHDHRLMLVHRSSVHDHRLMLVQVDCVACELMAKHWGGSWRIIRESCASKPGLRLVQPI